MLTKKDVEELEAFSKSDCSEPTELFKLSGLDPTTDFVGGDFSKVMLQKIDLSGFNFKGADFSKSILSSVNFSGANLKGVNFSKTNLKDANFTDALIDDTTDFSKAYLVGALGLDIPTTNNEIDSVGSILFIEDEPKSMLNSIQELYDTFPFIDIDIVDGNKDGIEKLRSNKYLFAIIDAKIPETSDVQANDLLGQKISEQLSSGEIEVPNHEMRHVILTEHKNAVLNTIGDLVENNKLVAVIEKSESSSIFKEKIINNIFDEYLQCLGT